MKDKDGSPNDANSQSFARLTDMTINPENQRLVKKRYTLS